MTILEQFLEQRDKLARAYIAPSRVTFSPNGFSKMMSQRDSMSAYTDDPKIPFSERKYAGLPVGVVNDQEEDIKVHNAMTDNRGRQNAITLTMKGPFSHAGGAPKTLVEIVAQSLDAAQLSDIIMHWLGADPHWGDFEKALHRAVEQYGRFE